MKSNEDIEEAVVTVHKMTEDEKMRRIADLREKALLDEKAIRRKGYQDGEKKQQTSIAKKLKDKGMQLEEIAEVTGLELEEIKKL